MHGSTEHFSLFPNGQKASLAIYSGYLSVAFRFVHSMSNVILVAEDEPFLRELIALDLQDKGFDIHTASDGEETIRSIEEQPPKLLLLDLLMPKIDGYEVLEHIRAKAFSFPIIVLSNLSDPSEQEKCRKLGASGFLVKSNIDGEDIWEKVKGYISY
jgi:CheY-like chemotaxis protein